MSTSRLTVSTGTARPYKPAVNQDAQDIANVVGDQVKQAIHQSLLDAASTADAKVRRSLQGQYPDEVLDAVAGPALAALAQSSKQGDAIAANSAAHILAVDITTLPKE